MSYPPVFEPSQLKPFLAAGHGIDPDDQYAGFPRGTGHYRKRRLSTFAPRRVSIERLMTPAEIADYHDWFETNIVVGETHFTALVANNQGTGQLWWDACWIEPYQSVPIATPKGVFWHLTGRLLLSGEGTSDRPDDGTLAVEYVAHLRGSAAIVGTHLLAVEYTANLSPTASLAVEYAADLQVTVLALPPPGAITISGRAPSILITDNHEARPPAGAITITGLAPAAAATASHIVAPGAGAISVSGLTPSIAQTVTDTNISPGAGSITVAGSAPTVLGSPAGLFGIGDTGMFFDFTDASTLFSDTGRTTLSTVGGQIRGVTDLSGTGRHLSTSQTGILRQQTGAVDYADFPGSGNALQAASGADGSATGLYFAIAAFRVTNATTTQAIFDMDQNIVGTRVSQTLEIGSSVAQTLVFNTAGSFFTTSGGTIAANTGTVISQLRTLTQGDIRVNGSIVGTTSGTTTAAGHAAGNPLVGASYLGTSNTNGRPLGGRVYAAFLINRQPTAGEIAYLEAWFAAKAI